jgi:nucleotide-binding universal stress UspA family protein
MTMIVGYAPDHRGKAALHLAAMLARSTADDLVVGSVVPAPWVPGMARIDAEYRAYLDGTADEALELARSNLPDDIPARFVRHSARSAPAGLLELAEQYDANTIVLGSSSAGMFGHIALGSVTDRLLHSSPVAIALSPRGMRRKPDAVVSRVTAAYGGSEEAADTLVIAAARMAARVHAAVRIASFAVWSRPAYTTRLGTDQEDLVLEEWTADIEREVHAALEQVEELADAPYKVEAVVGQGTSWGDAIEDVAWDTGDVMVIGSSRRGPVSRVFLGSRAAKIVRNSPVPVVVVPREQAEELAQGTE